MTVIKEVDERRYYRYYSYAELPAGPFRDEEMPHSSLFIKLDNGDHVSLVTGSYYRGDFGAGNRLYPVLVDVIAVSRRSIYI